MTTLVHAADLHIDSPMRGLAEYPGAPAQAIRGATRQALESLIELCLDTGAGLLIVAGDIFDGDWKDFSTALYLRSQLARLREAEVEVVLIHGNHDAASVITRKLKLPDIHVLPHSRPGTVVFEKLGLAVHGQSFATRAVTDNLAAGYPGPIAGMTNIGVLHTSLTGHAAHERYAPCRLDELVAHGYDYWALGHVHDHEVLHEHPHVVYAGNLQGRHMRECGAKGATVVQIDEQQISIEHRALDHVRWTNVHVDLGGATDELDVLERSETAMRAAVEQADGRLVASRVELFGMTTAHNTLLRERERIDAEMRGLAIDIGCEQIWLERIDWRTTPPLSSAMIDETVGAALKVLRRAGENRDTLNALTESLRPLALKLPSELRSGPDGIDPTDPETLALVLAEVQDMLPGMLTEGVA
jgi:exonuclease SbcD